jgi:hypothetical protein
MSGRGYVLRESGDAAFDIDSPYRFWELLSLNSYAVPFLIDAVVSAMDPWQECVLHSPQWHSGPATRVDERIRDRMMAGAGVPPAYEGGIAFDVADVERVIHLLTIEALLPNWRDVHVMFDHGSQLVSTDHHGVITVHARDETQLERIVTALAARDFPLPDAPPDQTFYWPEWMGPMPKGWSAGKKPATPPSDGA